MEPRQVRDFKKYLGAFQGASPKRLISTWIRISVWECAVGKRKVTLSIEEKVLREAKVVASLEGKSLSGLVEEYLESLAASRWLERLAASIGIGRLEPTFEDEIPSRRPKGLDSAQAVREARRSREERILHGLSEQ